MTEPPIEPEMWISDGPEGPDGGPPSGGAPRGPGRGWGRWIAIVAGFAVLLALVSVQHYLGGTSEHGAEPTTGVSVTPPPTTSHSETPTTDMTKSSTDAVSPGSALQGTNSDGVVTGTLHGGPMIVTTVPDTTEPAVPITSTGSPAELDAAPFDLVALLWDGSFSSGAAIVDYRVDTGATVRTELPALMSNGPMSFVVTATATIIRPWDGVPGYMVADGASAVIADGRLEQGGPVFPSVQADRVWAMSSPSMPTGTDVMLELVDAQGHTTGAIIKPPPSLGIDGPWGLRPDGAGGVLAEAVGGVYDLRPDGTRLVTHGRVLAAGPTGYIVYECSDGGKCTAAVLDRSTGKRAPLPRYTPPASAVIGQFPGVIASNGRYAALLDPAPGGPPLSILDLRTGERTPILLSIDGRFAGDASANFAFTPDSRVLAVMSGEYVRWVDPSTGNVLGELHLGPLFAISIRPAS
jgi:hypothetical protein